jgi:hypothetical protein
MANRSFGEELSQELTGKAVMWGPVIGGGLLLGPLGILLGLATSVAILSSDSGASPTSGGDNRGEKQDRN